LDLELRIQNRKIEPHLGSLVSWFM